MIIQSTGCPTPRVAPIRAGPGHHAGATVGGLSRELEVNAVLEEAAWLQYRMYCTHCHKWRHDIRHTDCPQGELGSLVLIDITRMRKGCPKCEQCWAIENVVFHCSCGHAQPVEYTGQLPPLQHGDKVLRTDGHLTWVRTKSHVVVVGQRSS